MRHSVRKTRQAGRHLSHSAAFVCLRRDDVIARNVHTHTLTHSSHKSLERSLANSPILGITLALSLSLTCQVFFSSLSLKNLSPPYLSVVV